MIEVLDFVHELRTRTRVLRLSLNAEWFDMIEAGVKLEEYRERKWAERILVPVAMLQLPTLLQNGKVIPFHLVRPRILEVSRGYTSRIHRRVIQQVRWGAPRPEWSGSTIAEDCFGIGLGESLDNRFPPGAPLPPLDLPLFAGCLKAA